LKKLQVKKADKKNYAFFTISQFYNTKNEQVHAQPKDCNIKCHPNESYIRKKTSMTDVQHNKCCMKPPKKNDKAINKIDCLFGIDLRWPKPLNFIYYSQFKY